jgi:hypothetical protein
MKLLQLTRRIAQGLAGSSSTLAEIQRTIQEQKVLTAKLHINEIRRRGLSAHLHEVEFSVFSQFGDDGIIQYLINNLEVAPSSFVEIGVEDYRESNTRFLLVNDNWKGLVIDSSSPFIDYIRQDSIYWRHELTAVNEFITAENINAILMTHGFSGELGLLSIDIDGNDYWIWRALNAVRPSIVIIEYNSVFGNTRAVTVPYDPLFNRTKAHHSNLYYGCSLKALDLLAREKGYAFIGSNSAGNNAYFLRLDRIGKLKPVAVEVGYVESRFRESRDAEGRLTHLSALGRRRAIDGLPVLDLETNALIKISEI